jgi:hypothetical protein
MYHSPGLRDGVSTQGMCVRPCPPEVLGAESIRTRFTGRGINSGARRSLCSAGFVCGHFLDEDPGKRDENSLIFAARTSCGMDGSVCSSLPSNRGGDCPQKANRQH